MRISDWSSDVCSSDLDREEDRLAVRARRELAHRLDIFLRDEIVDRLRIAARDRVRHHLRRLGLGLGLALARLGVAKGGFAAARSEEHTSELQSLMRTSYAVFCLTKHQTYHHKHTTRQ